MEIITTTNPEATLDQYLLAFYRGDQEQQLLALSYDFAQHYLPGSPVQRLLAVVAISRDDLCVGILAHSAEREAVLAQQPDDVAKLAQWLTGQGSPWLSLYDPMPLVPVHIPKPWGQEIWYTGIEERGQSGVTDGEQQLALPWLLSLCPGRLLGRDDQQLILLKILDPLPEPVFGDLYFEMHREKREVYVVTHIDSHAWPQGEGGIRFGFDQGKRQQADDDQHFKDDYLAAVQAYRQVREQIDALLDQRRQQAGFGLNEPVPAATLQQWQVDIPAELRDREASLRAAMEAFIHVEPLSVGDVIQVPTHTPHSLLHGVRTIEFQTPVYERQILSFAQKVLTQSHWDTEAALQTINLDAPERPPLPILAEGNGLCVEGVVNFDDFAVERLTLEPTTSVDIPLDEYRLLMTVAGQVTVNDRPLAREQACLVSAEVDTVTLANTGAEACIVLLARPRD